MLRGLFLSGAVLALAGCATVADRPAAKRTPVALAAASTAAGADDNLNAVAWTQTAVEHDLIYREVYRQALEKLPAALKDPGWDALSHEERTQPVRGLKPAVVLDIDETVLDNSPYQARLVRDGGAYNDATWGAWVKEEKADALPGALAFTQAAAKAGIEVIYISNRPQELDGYTRDNLRKLGFPVSGTDAFLGLGTYVKGCEQIGTQKTCRRQLIGRRYRVLMQLGDQIGDFLAALDNTPDGRRTRMAPYMDWIGERWFVFPNVTYGSWEPALFGNDWSQSRETRRRAKIEALHYAESAKVK